MKISTRPPRNNEPTGLERLEAAAYRAYQACPNQENEKQWGQLYLRLVNDGAATVSRCPVCGLLLNYRLSCPDCI